MMKFKIILVFLILSIVLYSCSEENGNGSFIDEETKVSGKIIDDTVWILDKSPYIVVGDVVVEHGVTLTIEPQVEIRFKPDTGLTVKGILVADGSKGFTPSDESELIKFTSNQSIPDIGDWRGLEFDNTNDDKSVVSYSKIQYAKIGIDIFSSSPKISDCIIHYNKEGIRLRDIYDLTISHNTITHNVYGIFLKRTTFHTSERLITISKNVITQNEVGIQRNSWGIYMVTQNHLSDNGEYSIIINDSLNLNLDASDNWWGTVDSEQISEQIYDKYDNPEILGEVLFNPFAITKVSDSGARF